MLDIPIVLRDNFIVLEIIKNGIIEKNYALPYSYESYVKLLKIRDETMRVKIYF